MVSDNIKRLRQALKMSQTEFAKRVHVTQGAVSQWENGLTRPDTEQVRIIAQEFGVSADDILGECGKPPAVQPKKDPAPLSEIQMENAALLMQLSPQEVQRVLDFAAGLIAARSGADSPRK